MVETDSTQVQLKESSSGLSDVAVLKKGLKIERPIHVRKKRRYLYSYDAAPDGQLLVPHVMQYSGGSASTIGVAMDGIAGATLTWDNGGQAQNVYGTDCFKEKATFTGLPSSNNEL